MSNSLPSKILLVNRKTSIAARNPVTTFNKTLMLILKKEKFLTGMLV